MIKRNTVFLLAMAGWLLSCGNGDNEADATGNFEADEVIVGAELAGRIVRLDAEEGRQLQKNELIGLIDTTQLYLRKKQLKYSIQAVRARMPNTSVQLAAVREQIATTEREKARLENLIKGDAATRKQLDDVNSQLEVLKRQLAAQESSLRVTVQSLEAETLPLQAQLEQLQDQITRSVIRNPVAGTVLTRYSKSEEMAAPGKALYRIADLSSLMLRAYFSGTQLSSIKIGQQVAVSVDGADGKSKNYQGTIVWVSDQAEFTPKTIQTKEERANLVYAVKIKVPNDGSLKWGMYGEVTLPTK